MAMGDPFWWTGTGTITTDNTNILNQALTSQLLGQLQTAQLNPLPLGQYEQLAQQGIQGLQNLPPYQSPLGQQGVTVPQAGAGYRIPPGAGYPIPTPTVVSGPLLNVNPKKGERVTLEFDGERWVVKEPFSYEMDSNFSLEELNEAERIIEDLQAARQAA